MSLTIRLVVLALVLQVGTLIGINTAMAQTKASISVGGTTLYRLPIYAALYQGFYKDEGLDVEIVPFNAGSDAIKVLVGGGVQFSSTPVIDVINLRKQGIDAKFVAAVSTRLNNSIVVRTALKDEIKTFADLGGRIVGTSGIGSGNWQGIMALAKLANMNPETIQLITLAQANVIPSFTSGRIDALAYIDPQAYQVVQSGDGFFLVDFGDDATHRELVGPEALFNGIVTTQAFIDSNPEVAQAFVNAIQRAEVWIKTQTVDELVAMLKQHPEWDSLSEEDTKGVLDRSLLGLPAGAEVSQAAYDGISKFLVMSGVVETPAPLTELVDNQFAVNAAEKYPAGTN